MKKKRLNIVLIGIVIISLSTLFSSCKKKTMEGMIVFTQVTGDILDVGIENSEKLISESRIVVINPNKLENKLKVLTEGYFSACAPQISYDGKSMLFAAQKKQNDVWEIFEMDLGNLKIRQVTSSTENCMDPAYLPDDRMVFSKFTSNNKVNAEKQLFTCNLDGSNSNQITFNPHEYSSSTVLNDGRILTISKQLFPTQNDGMFIVLRPDGTKSELFYKGLKGSELRSGGWETTNGKVIFIESITNDVSKGAIISINYNRPLHSRVNLSSEIKGDFYSVYPSQQGKFLTSYRSSKNNPYALYEFDAENKTLGKVIYSNNNFNAIEAVVVKKQDIPRKLPSEINLNVKTGLLLCQDINFTTSSSEENNSSTSKSTRIELLGMNTSLGKVTVEKDGSFYLKVLADTPFRIQTIDEMGQIIKGPGSWLYLRPNERRGCVGCHEDKEQIPVNRQPISVKNNPILMPVQKKEIH